MDYLKGTEKRKYDLGMIGIEMGQMFNSVGNFSLVPTKEGNWLACFRRFQYYIEGDRCTYLSSRNLFYHDRNHHLFALLDKDFNFIRTIPNPVSTYYDTEEWKSAYTYDGKDPFLEDARFTVWNGETYLTSAIYYYEDGKKKWATEIQKLDIHDDHIDAHHFWNTIEHGMRGNEKNWMSVPEKPFTFIAGTSTNGTRTVDLKRNAVWTDDFDAGDLYGGNTNLVKDDFRKCYYTITHRQFHGERGRRTYANHLVIYDEDLRPVQISKPFKLSDQPIEFATVLMELPNDELMIGTTEMDEKPMIFVYDKDEFVSKTMNDRGEYDESEEKQITVRGK